MQYSEKDLKSIPPWVRHFFTHVVKRSFLLWIKWIDEVNKVNKEQEQQQ